ncbi:uncharacterized protein E0L32_002567 [Thyridium curvatum]|uniref:F-box domain-containing protein n=1 Tax=Thyridium curvatum TaxID=1093900 RepID=A0A507BPM7_9PEZI|nr:uncharacterized protein E0L32_002567 [Thyridium curvatum]TPX18710.1 hypothetical protein E0L32_002567 [Thyridium curvatum]
MFGDTAAEKMDPLILAAHHNLTASRLCRLPEELLLEIMCLLFDSDRSSLQCLRRTCRLFLRLYHSPEFSSCHDVQDRDRDDSLSIKTFVPWYGPEPQCRPQEPLDVYLERDLEQYCQDCRLARTDPTWSVRIASLTEEVMHCSGCGYDHPRILFSARQRKTPAQKRICIGREGSMRICEHKFIEWHDVSKMVSSIERSKSDRFVEIRLHGCNHVSHHPRHHEWRSPETLNQPFCLRAVVTGSEKTWIDLRVKWHGHMDMSNFPYSYTGDARAATPTALCARLREFRKWAPRYIAPELPPGVLPEMNLLDPNCCACLHYEGAGRLPPGWVLTPVHELYWLACRTDPRHRLQPLRQEQTGQENVSKKPLTSAHMTSLRYLSSGNRVLSKLELGIEGCQGGGQCLQIQYERHILLEALESDGHRDGCPTLAWCQALDPDSYNLTDDAESFGVVWCKQVGCRNYYRYLRKPAVGLKSVNQECRKACPS